MRDNDRSAMIAAVDVRREEIGEWAGQGGKLRGATEVEEEKDSEDENEGESAETWVDKDGGEKHYYHHAMEYFATGVDFDKGGEVEDDAEA